MRGIQPSKRGLQEEPQELSEGREAVTQRNRTQPARQCALDLLLVGHDPRDPAAATLALAAVAGINGLRADGQPMPGADGAGRPATIGSIAAEIGLDRKAVRRGIDHLRAVGAVARTDAGILAVPTALASRWADPRRRLRLAATVRQLGLRAEVLLLAGLVAGQVDQRGQFALGVDRIGERLGLPRRTVQRALATGEAASAIRRWVAPVGRGVLVLAVGDPSRSGALGPSRSGALGRSRIVGSDDAEPRPSRSGAGGRPDPARVPSRSGAPPRPDPAHAIRKEPGVHPDHHPEGARGRARAAEGEPASPAACAPAAPEPEPVTVARPSPSTPDARSAPSDARGADDEPGGPDPAAARAAVERWVAAFARKGIETLTDRHLLDVAGLLDQIGPRLRIEGDHAVARDRRAALRNSRLDLARRVIAWCPSPERLGRWLCRVSRWFHVRNLAGYLRRAAQRGDPGTVLEGRTRRVAGRGAETWRDFAPATERALQGEHLHDVARIVAGTAAVLVEVDEAARDRLRAELREHLQAGRAAAAKATLLRLVPRIAETTDDRLREALRGACTVAIARELLAA
ncbi:MAG: hypothetical protein IT455_16520 [Planctomycetes bacterium]|nr:hypothetical protein [Planctomycetota bacterium]